MEQASTYSFSESSAVSESFSDCFPMPNRGPTLPWNSVDVEDFFDPADFVLAERDVLPLDPVPLRAVTFSSWSSFNELTSFKSLISLSIFEILRKILRSVEHRLWMGRLMLDRVVDNGWSSGSRMPGKEVLDSAVLSSDMVVWKYFISSASFWHVSRICRLNCDTRWFSLLR